MTLAELARLQAQLQDEVMRWTKAREFRVACEATDFATLAAQWQEMVEALEDIVSTYGECSMTEPARATLAKVKP